MSSTGWGVFQKKISHVCLGLFVFRCWSQVIGGFCLTVEQNCRFREISTALFSVYKIKINIWVSKDLKPSGKKKKKQPKNKKKRMWRKIDFPRVYYAAAVCSTLGAKSCSHSHFPFFFHHSFVCEVFYWLCSVSMNQCEWHKGVVEWRQTLDPRCCGIWDHMQHQQLYQYLFLHLGPLQRHFEDGLFLGSLLEPSGSWHAAATSSKAFLYQDYCCASALQLGLFFMF